MAKPSYVFNADQVDGYSKLNPLPVVANPAEKIAHVENFIAATNAKIEIGGQKAFYRLSDDTIHVPDPRLFVGTKTSTPTETYYSTMLHELGHWTGHKTRCDRDFGERFGNQKYAAEELVAELTAAFLCADLDIALEPRQDHAAYLNSWLTVLKNDKKAIFTAAAAANKASDFLHNLQPALQEKAA
jgi:antirestriction protein ArdC